MLGSGMVYFMLASVQLLLSSSDVSFTQSLALFTMRLWLPFTDVCSALLGFKKYLIYQNDI